jgi:hypothetical protein
MKRQRKHYTPEELSPTDRVKGETDYFRFADDPKVDR